MFRRRPWVNALWALAAFRIWDYHVATGYFDKQIEDHVGKRSGVISTMDTLTDALLVFPLGRPAATLILTVTGIVSAVLAWKITSNNARR